MTARARQYAAEVASCVRLSPQLARLTLTGPELSGFASTGVPDEWVGLVVPGQFQSRYYTVRSWDGHALVLDVVLHEQGLVTEWVGRRLADPAFAEASDTVTITEPRGSFAPPAEAAWVLVVGDLTALPAMARICADWAPAHPDVGVRVWAEAADRPDDYFPATAEVSWLVPPEGGSALAEVVGGLTWPEGPGYFWMAGESAQMRAIRKHLMSTRPGLAFDVMGYWRAVARRQPRAVDPAPIWRAGKASGATDAEIWAAYDAAREAEETQG